MAKLRIPFLVEKNGSFYWQPSKPARDAGWEPAKLGKNEGRAIAAALELNVEYDAWMEGGREPIDRAIAARPLGGTLGEAIARYRARVIDGKKPNGDWKIARSTAKTYRSALGRLEQWGGKQPVTAISRARVRKLRDGMLANGVGEHAVHTTLKLGRQLFAFLIDEEVWTDPNPFENFGMAQPAPREVIWSPPARELIVQTAEALQRPSVALAIVLGYSIGQREGDILAAVVSQYVALPEHKMQPEDYAVLSAAAPDGQPRGVRIRQSKTKAWIEVPVVGDTRTRIEANIARAKEQERFNIVLDDTRSIGNRVATYEGKAGQTRFQRDFAEVREAAACEAEKMAQPDLSAEIRTLEFRDLRRTCVVYLGELGLEDHVIAAITGHDIDETRRILKTYMPRTTGRAAHGIARVVSIESGRKKEADG